MFAAVVAAKSLSILYFFFRSNKYYFDSVVLPLVYALTCFSYSVLVGVGVWRWFSHSQTLVPLGTPSILSMILSN